VAGRGEASLGRLIEGVLANLDLRTRFREHLAVVAWPDIAGRVVAAHSQAEAVRDGVLIVSADTPAWANELQMRRQELLKLVEGRVGSGVIRDIHFRSGARRRGRRTRGRGQAPAEVSLSGRQQRRIAEAAAKIDDGELRGKAERAFTSLARMAEWRKRSGWRRCRRCGRWQRVGRRWCASCTHSGARRRRK
jgi:predicted nucleic acid-binding Zn ribbon protein